MIKSFSIQNFRCFDSFTIEPLEQINLIVGRNNVGKTALLEALFLHFGYFNPALPLSIDNFRGLEKFRSNELLWDLFHGFDPSKIVKLVSLDEANRPRTLTIEVRERNQNTIRLSKSQQKRQRSTSGLKPVSWQQSRMDDGELHLMYINEKGETIHTKAYIEDDKFRVDRAKRVNRTEAVFMPTSRRDTNEDRADRLSKLLKTRHTEQVIRTLKILEDRIEDITILLVAGDPVVHAAIKGEKQLMPLPLMGDGIVRLFSIALAITFANGGAVCIDEIENGLHHSVMPNVGQAIAELAYENDVQIFATSHNEEYINAMRTGIKKSSSTANSGRLFRLERKENQIEVVSYTLDELEIAERHGIEVR